MVFRELSSMNVRTLKRVATQCRSGAYFRPSNFRVALAQVVDVNRNLRAHSDRLHLLAATNWLKRAQDATRDGGFVGRYNLRTGWSSSYPETTGYIIPTLLKLADELQQEEFIARAQRAVDFLLSVQLPNGAFPGSEIAENSTKPSPFNTAQIMHGLQSWVERTHDERCRTALQRAGSWLCGIQDPSGAWRKFSYLDLETTYSAHLTCWLAEAGAFLGDDRMLAASSRHLAWLLQHYDSEHAWFDLCGFSKEDHEARRAVTHTIAYTLWGVLRTSEVLGSAEGKAAAESSAYAALRRLELSRRLPGVLDYRWRPMSSYDCLTGNAQMALIWLHMYEYCGDPRLLSVALKAIDIVKAAQIMESDDPGVAGAIAGSQPLWGEYIQHTFPNWAAKYFIDALLAKQKEMEKEIPFRSKPVLIGEPAPTALPGIATLNAQTTPKVALLTSELSTKVMEFHSAWSKWSFRPHLVLIERRAIPPFWSRVRARVAEGRITQMPNLRRPYGTPLPMENKGTHGGVSVLEFCKQAGIPAIEVDSINSAESVRLLQENTIDLFVYAGAGILKKLLIEAAPLGVLNAHMGLLPSYRGMNVAEWAAWNRDPVGCSVYLIDSGIDTGDILLIRKLDVSSARNVSELRNLVDQSQIELLGEVVRYVLKAGKLPPRRSQTEAEGLQYFTMHPTLLDALHRRLAGS
jgi:folate-dependent phosphoribosylglycinamide formyltransferase PurN